MLQTITNVIPARSQQTDGAHPALWAIRATLQRARTHTEGLRHCIDGRAVACQPVLNGAAHQFNETVLFLKLPQLLLELRCEHIE